MNKDMISALAASDQLLVGQIGYSTFTRATANMFAPARVDFDLCACISLVRPVVSEDSVQCIYTCRRTCSSVTDVLDLSRRLGVDFTCFKRELLEGERQSLNLRQDSAGAEWTT